VKGSKSRVGRLALLLPSTLSPLDLLLVAV
jgi:hypothetical protein